MAFLYDVTRVTLSGDCYDGNEEWATGFWVGNTNAASLVPSQAAVDSIAASWATFFAASTSDISAGFRTLQVKMAQLAGTDEHVIPGTTFFHHYVTPPVGARVVSNQFPPQIALVASLDASPNQGLAGKGRMFLPGVCKPFDVDGQISANERQEIAGTLKTFFDAVNASTTVGGSVINVSRGRAGVPGFEPPINRVVSTVRIGSVYDTQRRRRNQLKEQYSVAAVVP